MGKVITFTHHGPDLISADHTGAPDELEGTDLAAAMVDHLVADARARGFKVAPNFRLSGDKMSFPLVAAKGIPFIYATINGVRGKLMLDTGAKRALSLNGNRIPLAGGKAAGSGFFGSGQRFDIIRHVSIATVDVGGFSFRDVKIVESQDARMLESVTPDFAGWMGFDFWRGYALELDYVNNVATFYRDEVPAEGRLSKYLAGETVFGAIHYETRSLPNIMMIKGIMIEGAGTYEMSVGVLPAPFPAATPIGLTTSNVVAFGYSFLSQYKTVWDFAGKTIYLMEK